ncbi:TadE/TadG family type IV pilus assembly protein [Sphingomonas sp.]|uniref:TadE/TadG family type IV pilus assembly protein n=1 Tax=Sphingomonas sp. TaxID=28214 RepID=UPI003AFFA7CF
MTLVEFAFVAPVMLLMIFGVMDLGFRLYVQSILTGAMQRAGRDASLETGASRASTLDDDVVKSVHAVVSNATWASSRQSFSDYGSIKPEPFTDSNSNGVYDVGECYSDVNDNGSWDENPGRTGLGGANDAVIYTMTITYPRLFPLAGWLGWTGDQVISSRTVLKNQPYSTQNGFAPVTRCS